MLIIAVEAAKEAGHYLKDNVGRVKNMEFKNGEERSLAFCVGVDSLG